MWNEPLKKNDIWLPNDGSVSIPFDSDLQTTFTNGNISISIETQKTFKWK
jgi:hypothetical protein